jgi:hypothetical protein
MSNGWTYGPCEPYFLEEKTPTYNAYHYYFDMDDVPPYTWNLLHLLRKLNIIEYGLFFETTELIRIRDGKLERLL